MPSQSSFPLSNVGRDQLALCGLANPGPWLSHRPCRSSSSHCFRKAAAAEMVPGGQTVPGPNTNEVFMRERTRPPSLLTAAVFIRDSEAGRHTEFKNRANTSRSAETSCTSPVRHIRLGQGARARNSTKSKGVSMHDRRFRKEDSGHRILFDPFRISQLKGSPVDSSTSGKPLRV